MRNAEFGTWDVRITRNVSGKTKLPSLFRRGAEALRGGVVVKKNQILFGLPPLRRSGVHPS